MVSVVLPCVRACCPCACWTCVCSAGVAVVKLLGLLLVGLIVISLTACAPRRTDRYSLPSATSTPQPSLPRADPGHTNWLERQSVLGAARGLAPVVSASPLNWRPTDRQAASRDGADPLAPLLVAADVWLHIAPHTLLHDTSLTTLAVLAQPGNLETLAAHGIRGVYLAPALENGGFWQEGRTTSGDDAVALRGADTVGSDEAWQALAARAAQCGMQLGGDLLPAAPGIGPDFFLATQGVRDYPGIWMMTEIPRALWTDLPAVPAGNRAACPGVGIDGPALEKLIARGLLPAALPRDRLAGVQTRSELPPGGWAVTGEVPGTDGAMRRWVYRYDRAPSRPVLAWDDPSAAARRMLSASAIRQVGVLRSSLVGVRLAPLFGLDAGQIGQIGQVDKTLHTGQPQAAPADALLLEPGLAAANALGREIARYGGYSLERTLVPLPLAVQALTAGIDLIADSITFPAAEYAVLTGDAAPLRAALDAAQHAHLPQHRLVRELSRDTGIPLSLLSAPQRAAVTDRLRISGWSGVLPYEPDTGVLYATLPALAAARVGLSPDGKTDSGTAEQRHTAARLSVLALALRAGLPGMLWVSGQDLAGTTHAGIIGHTTQGASQRAPHGQGLPAWGLRGETSGVTRAGVPAGARVQADAGFPDASFGPMLEALTRMRRHLGLPLAGSVTRIPTRHTGSLALSVRLPDGRSLITMYNFSESPATERLPQIGLRRLAGADCVDEETPESITIPAYGWIWLMEPA